MPPPPAEPIRGCQRLLRWVLFGLTLFSIVMAQVLDVWLTVRLFQDGSFGLPWLMILGFFYSRGLKTYRGISGFHLQTEKFAAACRTFFRSPGGVMFSFLRLDEIKAQYGVLILKQHPKQLATLCLCTAMADSVPQLYLKCISLMFYWQESAGLFKWGWMLVSALGSTFSVCVAFLQWELVSAKDNGFKCPRWYSGFGICHLMTRLSELTSRCLGVAAWVVFFPFPAWTAAVLLTEEVMIIFIVIMAKAYQNPNFLSTMRSGRCGPVKLYAYILVVMWPMYWCMHTQTYIGAVPRPAFSYTRYYLLRVPFTWTRALGLFLVLHFHAHLDATMLGLITSASVAGSLSWMVLFPVVRKMAVGIHHTKGPEETAKSVAATATADSREPPVVNPQDRTEKTDAETSNAKPPACTHLEDGPFDGPGGPRAKPSCSDAEVAVTLPASRGQPRGSVSAPFERPESVLTDWDGSPWDGSGFKGVLPDSSPQKVLGTTAHPGFPGTLAAERVSPVSTDLLLQQNELPSGEASQALSQFQGHFVAINARATRPSALTLQHIQSSASFQHINVKL